MNSASPTSNRSLTQSGLFKRWLVLWPASLGLILYPVNNLALRLSVLIILAALFLGLLCLYWKNRILRLILFVIAGTVSAFLLLPGRSYDPALLRRDYVASLLNYESTRYVWGGENRMGIDCSGLIRSGLIKASYQQGLLTLNPGLVREGLDLWWHDSSERALGEEYRQTTRKLFSESSINQIDHSQIMPGDFAVTEDGIHALAYVGDHTWIKADPEIKRVIKVQVPSNNSWFDQPVNVMRWVRLE